MKKILFGSIVRDGESYLPRYFDQLKSLTFEYEIGLAICEGDSTDNTYNYLLSIDPIEYNLNHLQIFKFDHKGNKYGSVNVAERWANIARTWNYMLDRISFYDQYDYFCYMECDLIWTKETINKLVFGMNKWDCVAPMSMLGNLFYDTWGHRSVGVNFSNMYPFHPEFEIYSRYMPLESAGSCILMKSQVAKECRLANHDAMIGHDIVKKGYSFVLDKQSKVIHP